MTGRNGALFFGKIHAYAAVGEKRKMRFLKGLAMTDTDEYVAFGNGFGNEIEFFRHEGGRVEFVGFSLIDVENVVLYVFFNYVPRKSVVLSRYAAHAETFVLTEGVKENAFVLADDLSVESADFSFFHRNVLG